MEFQDVKNDGIQDKSTDAPSSARQARIEKCFRFYRAKAHLISIPIIIIISIIHLKYGIKYLGQCPIQPKINIYLIVNASVALLLMLIAIIGVITARIYPRLEKKNEMMIARRLILIVIIFTLILSLFSLAWLVTGAVWIFGAKKNGEQGSNPQDTTTYCQPNLYRAAFTLVIINLIFHSVIILIIIIKCIRGNKQHTVPPPVVTTDRF